MKKQLPRSLVALAEASPKPLYAVGGSVRDFCAGKTLGAHTDWDLASPMSEDELIERAQICGFRVRAVYRNTGTVKLEDGEGCGYEFTRFRSDTYVRGLHTPSEITFTDDLCTDAKRRDFCANAVYYDVKRGEFVDPLGGIPDIRARKLRTVREAERVFGEDGLRLMRLARIAAETGFSPDENALRGAYCNRQLIRDIAPERIFSELRLLLSADSKSGLEGPYRGLTLLKETGVLAEILPELAAGEGMRQRSDYHAHDVLEHSLLCVRYSPPEIRFAALLHDVGKPFCYLRDGTFHAHAEEGARLAETILLRLKAPHALVRETAELVRLHMRDFDGRMRPNKVRREIRGLGPLYPRLLALKQADFTACMGDRSPAPTAVKWEKIRAEMVSEGVPFTVSDLAIGGREIRALGVKPERTAETLSALLDFCLYDGSRNRNEILGAYVMKHFGPNGSQDGNKENPNE